MTEQRQTNAEEFPTMQTEGPRPQNLWSAVAPPIAWWWLVLAGAAALILGFGFLRAVQLFARPLSVLILGIAIAASLAPLVNRLNRWLPRTLAVSLIYLVLLLVVVAIGWFAFPLSLNQLLSFNDRIPEYLNRAQAWFNQRASSESDSISRAMTSLLGTVGIRLITLPLTLGRSVLQIVMILFISLYALIVAQRVHDFVLSLVPERERQRTGQLMGDMSKAMGGYVRGVVISGLIVGVITYVGLLLLGVEYALLLALVAAMLEVVPILGTIISTVIIVAVALLQSPHLGLLSLIFMLVLQQIQGNIVFPNVMSRQANISPLLGISAFFAGGVVGGLLGAIVAIPLVAALRVLVIEVVAPMVRRWTGAKTPLIKSSEQKHKEDHAKT